jgi:cytochrome c biogenesis protein CcmG, thiol:disulfide interchange protein DsbE
MVPTEELQGYRPRSRVPKLVVAIAVATIVVVALLPAREKAAPRFDLPLLSSSGRLSSEDLRGSPVVLNFFASWCAPCREEAPRFESAYQKYKDEGVRFVGVNVQDRIETARRFVEDYGVTFPVVVDADRKLAEQLGVFGLPQTFFIREDGALAGTKTGQRTSGGSGTATFGALSVKELEAGIEDVLGETR